MAKDGEEGFSTPTYTSSQKASSFVMNTVTKILQVKNNWMHCLRKVLFKGA